VLLFILTFFILLLLLLLLSELINSGILELAMTVERKTEGLPLIMERIARVMTALRRKRLKKYK
jgi:hypothetical protein